MARDKLPDEGETVKLEIREDYPDQDGNYDTYMMYGYVKRHAGDSSFKFESESGSTYTVDVETMSMRKLIYQAGGDEDYIDSQLIGWSSADESKLI